MWKRGTLNCQALVFRTFSDNRLPRVFLDQMESVPYIVNMFFNFKSTSPAEGTRFKVLLRSYCKPDLRS